MKTFTVHHPSDTPAGVLEAPEKAVFLKEGAAWVALFVPFFWALFHRMWIVAVLILAAAMTFGTIAQWLHLSAFVTFTISSLINFLIALEGNELRRWTLERKGHVLIGIVSANNLADCEQIFFERLVRETETANQRIAPVKSGFQLAESGGDGDLFPVAGGGR